MPCCRPWYEPEDETAIGRPIFIIGHGGGGHKASANAVKDCLLAKGVEWAASVELLDCEWLVTSAILGSPPKPGSGGEDMYNLLMRIGAYRSASMITYGAPLSAFLLRPCAQSGMRKFWAARKPTIVVSFVPHFNTHFRNTLAGLCPLVTVATDMASTVAHRWVDAWDEKRGRNHHLVAGTPKLQAQARALGWAPPHLLCSSGMVVNPAFYEEPPAVEPADAAKEGDVTRDATEQEWVTMADGSQLRQADARAASAAEAADASTSPLTGLIFFGGFAPARTLQIVRKALRSQPELRLVVICGHNGRLLETLRTLDQRVSVLGFIAPGQVRAAMRAASFIVGKPGPGVIAEACVCGVPFVVERKRVMAHERGSLQWLEDSGAGVVINSLEELPATLGERIAPCRAALAQMRNRAVFEVGDLVEEIASRGVQHASGLAVGDRVMLR